MSRYLSDVRLNNRLWVTWNESSTGWMFSSTVLHWSRKGWWERLAVATAFVPCPAGDCGITGSWDCRLNRKNIETHIQLWIVWWWEGGKQRCWKTLEVAWSWSDFHTSLDHQRPRSIKFFMVFFFALLLDLRFLSIQWMVPCLRRRQWAANGVFFLAVSLARAWPCQRRFAG